MGNKEQEKLLKTMWEAVKKIPKMDSGRCVTYKVAKPLEIKGILIRIK